MIVKVKRSWNGIAVPAYQTPGAAGCDVQASEKKTVPARGIASVGTGHFLEVPSGYECQVRPRSGLAAKHGVTVLNAPGTLDSDYRGELRVILANHSDTDFEIEAGDRIAQLVFAPVVQAQFELADELSETKRGSGGFGSTGV